MIISPYRNINLVKRDLYDEDSRESTINSNIFEDVDKHSLEVITHNYETFEDFIRNLIFLKDFDDTQKTRAIFRWITMNDLKKINLDHLKSGSAEEAIYLFINGNIDHAELFSVLSWKVGIRCEIIEGLTKDPLFKTGDDKLTPRRWNAVLIDRQWKLIDICWSTKYFCDEFTRPTSSINEFYFFSNPKHLIFTHFPANLKWQLLNPAIQQETFLSFPAVNSKFFKYNFRLTTHEGVVETYNGFVVIRIGHDYYPGNNLDNNCISYTFNHIDSNEIKDHVLQETKTDEEIFHIRCPRLGAYHFTINHDSSSSSPNQPKHKRTLNHAHFDKLSKFQPICQYKIICHANPKPRPFPMSHATIGWGSHLLPLKRFKILPSHTSAVLTTRNKTLDLFFRKLRSEVRMYALMFKSGQSSKEFRENVRVLEKKNYYKENCGAVDPKTDTPQMLVSITLPQPDEYCLEIYANDPNIDGNNFVLICRHIVIGQLGRESSIVRDDVSKHLHRSIPSNLSRKEETFPGDDNDSNQRKVQKINSFEHEELRQTRATISDDKMEHPQLIVSDNKVINTDQYLDWSTSRPRKCFPFKYNLEPKPTVLQIKAQAPNHYYDDACTRCGDIEIIEEDQNLSLEIRSNIIYQSRLQRKLKTTQAPAAYDPKRKLILLTGKDLVKRTQN